MTHVAAHWVARTVGPKKIGEIIVTRCLTSQMSFLIDCNIGGRIALPIRFAKHFDLNSEVRKIPGAKFSATNSCWYVANGKGVFDSILQRLQWASVDDSACVKWKHQPQKYNVRLNILNNRSGCDTAKTRKRSTSIFPGNLSIIFLVTLWMKYPMIR